VSGTESVARRRTRLALVGTMCTALIATALCGAPAANAVTLVNATIASASASLTAPIVGIATTPSGRGYWRVARDGRVFASGDARSYGSAAGQQHDAIVGIAATPDGRGYWLADRKGAVFNFGNAPYRGSTAGRRLLYPIVGIAARPDGQGYWLVATNGSVFAFHAPFVGSTASRDLLYPIVGMSPTPDGLGYRLVARNGSVFAFHAAFFGSTAKTRLAKPIIGMATLPNATGYLLVGADGRVFRFPSTVPYYGSATGACPLGPAIGIAVSPGAVGYWITFSDSATVALSPTSEPPTCGPIGTSMAALATKDLFARLNAERAARGLAALRWDPTLATYAGSWSANMAAHGFRHSDIGGLLGSFNYVGENIAMGSRGVTAGALHVAWMHSDGHRSNMLAPGFNRVGIGVYCASDGSLWATQDFGRTASAGPAPSSATPTLNPIARSDAGTSGC
jgi:uncharacterized protein YkwD